MCLQKLRALIHRVVIGKDGSVLYIEGPSHSSSAHERTSGMLETKPSNIQVAMLKARWTEESAARAVRSWLKLATSQSASIDLVGAQDDSMAMGARKAFQEMTNEAERSRWLSLPPFNDTPCLLKRLAFVQRCS
jgi:ribose transport system substrate-binding protein